jgi:FkbM family methyltransferase
MYDELVNSLKKYPTKDGIKVNITNHFYEKEELVKWCAQNTLNVFLYNRNIQGLSATTDQAITSGRPMAISTDNTFRHIHQYIKPYPFQSLKESIADTDSQILKLQNDWSQANFALRFKKILNDYGVKKQSRLGKVFKLPVKNKIAEAKPKRFNINKSDFVPPIIIKAYKKFFSKTKQQTFGNSTLTPFVHYILQSYSQFNEDLLLDLLLGQKEKGFYIDIGANDPSFNSNTKRFYLRGWNGINIEPNLKAFNNIKDSRLRDVNLNLAISEQEGELTFYYLSDDSSLSTLDYETAERMAAKLNLNITSENVKTNSLKNILDKELQVNAIDFMSVDAEGHDLVVLKSNNWDKYRPAIVMVESNNEFIAIRSFMDGIDYLHIFSNHYNAIFIDKRTVNQSLLKNIKWEA